ncbi:DUF948 domain-containing protein [Paenibacillus xylaniclasticus]|uniref:DUF948 domain-containing protein n=1 Tax=Paenibacillus xylaniclasticus TaxID=588083 RepID=UPI000FD88ABF|nr:MULTISPECIES: DUF948 domain-containing protein [Paenibacillus]GFN30200.1 hypothetical protein PCURB6_04600 [Paenibacillus curdlanolyticus]
MITIGCIVAVTVIFAALTAGLLIGLRTIVSRVVLIQLSSERLEQDVRALLIKLQKTSERADETLELISAQLRAVSGLFQAASLLGESVENASAAVNSMTAALSNKARQQAERIENKKLRGLDEALDWAEVGMTAWQLWQSVRDKIAKKSACSGEDDGYDKRGGSDS